MDFRLPELGEGVYEAEMTRWLVGVGDRVAPGQGLLEVLTDKATMEVPSPFAGIVTGLNAEPGQALKIGQLILKYDTSNGEAAHAEAAVSVPAVKEAVAAKSENGKSAAAATSVKAAPAVRQMAKERGIDLAAITGTGPEGRILIGDLPRPVAKAVAADSVGEFGRAGTRVKLQGLRRKIAEHMAESTRTIPHFHYVDECNVTDLVHTRVGLRDLYAKQNVKLTYLAFFVKAVALALKEFPIANASLDESTEEIVMHDAYHIGIAVATPGGLVVPVIRDADRKSLIDIARDIQRLSDDARANRIKLDDLRGGTFTLTSIGNIGGLFASPIIHKPQVGIMAIGKFVSRPMFDERQQIVPAEMAYLSFGFDHRVVDGAVAVQFGNAVMRFVSKPLELAIG
jgi:pyruvate/2-oxoglutarate dehydrogenase complex dihydrolipoamide acyltransferase (E2) component